MHKRKRLFHVGLMLVLTIIITGWNEQAQSQVKYPTRAIDIIVPFAPGGGVDQSARILAAYLSKKWGVPINVINKPGGNTLPANMDLYSAAPDGYTLLNDSPPSSSMLQAVVKDLPFKMMDRTFIVGYISWLQVFMVPSSSPYKTLNDVIADAKKDPENFTWGSLGGASGLDMLTRQLFKAIGVDVMKTKPVMFKGGAQVTAAVAGGHIKLGSTSPVAARAPFKAGAIRIPAITRVRYPEFPDVPTTAELGYPSVNCVQWAALSGPPKMPSYIVEFWEREVEEMLKNPEVAKQIENIGFGRDYKKSATVREEVRKEAEEVADLWGIKK